MCNEMVKQFEKLESKKGLYPILLVRKAQNKTRGKSQKFFLNLVSNQIYYRHTKTCSFPPFYSPAS